MIGLLKQEKIINIVIVLVIAVVAAIGSVLRL